MKDKRIYLKIACLLEIIYIIATLIYYSTNKFNTYGYAPSVFMLLLSSYFTYLLYNESKKDVSYLKENNLKIWLCSIWFFLEPIIPGVLGFVFLSSLKDKKESNLPKVKHDEVGNKDIIKSIVTIACFVLILFVLPSFKFFNSIPSYAVYAFILVGIFILYYKELVLDFKTFIKNIKVYLPFIIKRYFIMLGLMFLVAIPIVMINGEGVSSNQEAINVMFKKVPWATLLLSCLYAPLTEETVFRLSLSKLFKNKLIFIIVSGFLFGALHVISDLSSISNIIYVFLYATLGMCLAKAYSDTNNIFVSISMHFIQNSLAAMLILLVY